MHPQSVLLLASLHLVLGQAPTDNPPKIDTPASLVQCLPSLLTFSGGVPPYTISAIPGGQTGALPLVEMGAQTGNSYTWVTNLAAGTFTTIQIRDSKGAINYSKAVTVQPSSDDSCLKSSGTPTNTAPPGASTGTVPPPPPKGGNNTSGSAQPNATAPTTTPNTTSSTPNPSTGGPTNSSKGPSPFVPPPSTNPTTTTPVNNNPNNAATNAPGNAASSVADLCQQAFFAGLAVAASVSVVFA